MDLNQSKPSSNEEPKEEVIYDVINSNNERSVQEETDYDSVMYTTPKKCLVNSLLLFRKTKMHFCNLAE